MTLIPKEERAKIVHNHNLTTIKRILDKLWDEFLIGYLPQEVIYVRMNALWFP